jgi:hypothetical protein
MTYDTYMETYIKEWTLNLIKDTEATCQTALETDNLKSMGYPYAAGASMSTLRIIKGLLEDCQ